MKGYKLQKSHSLDAEKAAHLLQKRKMENIFFTVSKRRWPKN